MRDRFVSTLMRLAQGDPNVHLITGDLGFGVLKPFWEQYPQQFTNAGIAEQNMTSFAAGMALEGKTVFTYSIGNFPTLRALEQIRNDCAYHDANVKIVSVGGGFVYGPLGMSHHATEDLAIMRALPNVTVVAPIDPAQAERATEAIYGFPGTCYLRLGRGGERDLAPPPDRLEIGAAVPISEGESDVAILFTGGIGDEVMDAKAQLVKVGIVPTVISFPTVKPIDRSAIQNACARYGLLVTVEEHNLSGGFGGAVAEVVATLRGPRAALHCIGIKDEYVSTVGSQTYLRRVQGLDANSIVADVLDRIGRTEG